ncbi:hypothetical protein [Uliginosibacterium gangwonense]|uniref:hypothetical protein n=1 Tax=Uliginosibacterium gangwonense TaxID=392736 RepID=UPI0012F80E36|nr:hypothetical protein [Uliginosibacterium gangwonense]
MSSVSSASGLSAQMLYSMLGIDTPTTSVSPTNDTSLALTAAEISTQASVIASLTGTQTSSTATSPLYNAAGLLNALIQAGTANSGSSGNGSTSTTDTMSEWAKILQSNPDLASSAVAAAYNQSIVSNLLAIA